MRWKTHLRIFGISVMFTGNLLFAVLFIMAFYSGWVNDVWRATIDINQYQEAVPELLIFIILGLPLTFYVMKDYLGLAEKEDFENDKKL